MTSNVNNQGIMHLAHKPGGLPVCKRRNIHMSTTADQFEQYPKRCKRCAAIFAKWQAKRAEAVR